MAGPATSQDTYERNAVNDCSLGKDFEVNVTIYSVLTQLHQSDQHAVAFEYKQAPAKFDDVVLRVQNGTDHEFYYRQLKHRDTTQGSEAYLTWNDLLKTKKSPSNKGSAPFGIPWYYECFLAQQNPAILLKDVKELAFVTNYNLAKQGSVVMVNNLEDLAKRLLHPTAKTPKHHITEGDLKYYFQECSDTSNKWRPPSADQKSYRFTTAAIDEIFKGTTAAKVTFSLSLYKKFLELLVFRVSMPHVDTFKTINQTVLKVFLPFYKNLIRDKYNDITKEFMQLFEKTTPVTNVATATSASTANIKSQGNLYQAAWATAQRRSLLLERLANSWETNVPIDKTTYYFNLANNVSEQDWAVMFRQMMHSCQKDWAARSTMPVVNIYNADSNATVINLKVSKTIQRCMLQWRTMTIQAQEKNDIDNAIEYFEELDKDVGACNELVFDSFCCVIQIKPIFSRFDEWRESIRAQITQRLTSLANLRKWIRFLIITKEQMCPDRDDIPDWQSIEDMPLTWQDLAKDYQTFLLDKKLYLDVDKETNLRALGFEEDTIGDWLLPKALGELIIHDKENPISLGLPKKDTNLEIDYVEREIQLPLVKNVTNSQNASKLFTCDETEFKSNTPSNEYQHLLSTVSSKQWKKAFLWARARNNKSVLGLKEHIVPSKNSDVTVRETQLLKDDVNFGTGSPDNKLLVIVDFPGKGKTCLLTSLSNRFLDEWSYHANRLLLSVNLREVKDWEDSKSGLEFLVNHSKGFGRARSAIGNKSLTLAIVNRKCLSDPASVFVLLDGYDEISDQQRELTLNVIDDLKKLKGIKRIILTSRPEANLENELEQHFGQFSLHLKNFTKQDQIRYLTKRWSAKLEMRDSKITELQRGKITIFTAALVDFARNALKDEKKTFLDVPLQCWIFSECFFQRLLHYIERRSESEPEFEESSFEILRLYDRFFEAKIDVLLQEKANISLDDRNEALSFLREELNECFLSSMMRLSIIHMMKAIDDAILICCLNWGVYRSDIKMYRGEGNDVSQYSRDLKRAMKLGVVHTASEDDKSLTDIEPQDIRFLHRTFAEYFFARALLRSFIQSKSELMDGTSSSSQDILENIFKLISEKVLLATEYAGIRRFLDRMLANHLPPVGELCPFANESRPNVLRKWPAVGHERFNKYLAESIISKNKAKLVALSACEPNVTLTATKLLQQDYMRPIPIQSFRNRRVGIGDIVGSDCKNVPSITSMLIHCIKEYATRPEISDEDRETLAFSFTTSALVFIQNGFHLKHDTKRTITSSLFHWFDKASGSPRDGARNVFSKWFLILLSALIRKVKGQPNGAIALSCKMLRCHADVPEFEDSIFALIAPIFSAKNEHRAYQFFDVSLDIPDSSFDPDKADWSNIWATWSDFQRAENQASDEVFHELLVSLNARNFLGNYLLERLAHLFADKLEQRIELIVANKQPCTVDDLNSSPRNYSKSEESIEEKSRESIDSAKKVLEEIIVNPYAFIQTVKFFMGNVSRLSETTTSKILNGALNYVIEIQRSLLALSQQVDLLYVILSDRQMCDGVQSQTRTPNDKTRDFHTKTTKVASISLMLWYSIVLDVITCHIRDEKEKSQTANLLFTDEISQKTLTGYAYAGCCCQCNGSLFTGFGVHFPYVMYTTDKTEKAFGDLLAGKLEIIWEKKSETEFIDFLFNIGKDFSNGDSVGDIEGAKSTNMSHHQGIDVRQRRAESVLRAIRVAKLPCLLFSDIVGKYIPQKLSSTGLQHLANTLKTIPMLICEMGCYSIKAVPSPILSDGTFTLWDATMQEDESSPKIFRCKWTGVRVKALQQKLKEATASEYSG